MPYTSTKDLPSSIRGNLPVKAQSIFMAVFNSAHEQYDGDEERAFKIAWGAVKKKYSKGSSGSWIAKENKMVEAIEGHIGEQYLPVYADRLRGGDKSAERRRSLKFVTTDFKPTPKATLVESG